MREQTTSSTSGGERSDQRRFRRSAAAAIPGIGLAAAALLIGTVVLLAWILRAKEAELAQFRDAQSDVEQFKEERKELQKARFQLRELDRLRRENQELHRLRNEVRMLREERQKLETARMENQQLQASLYAVRQGEQEKVPQLHSWLVTLESADPSERTQGEVALRALGASAVPTLIEWLPHGDSVSDYGMTYEAMALCGFRVLGTNASSGLPDLRRFLDDSTLAFSAAAALVWIDPSEAQWLAEQWITNPDPIVQGKGRRLLQEIVDQ